MQVKGCWYCQGLIVDCQKRKNGEVGYFEGMMKDSIANFAVLYDSIRPWIQ